RDLIEDLIKSGHLRKFLEDAAAKGHIAFPKQEIYPPKKEGGKQAKAIRAESPLTLSQEVSQE
ncbi:hypothetical protein A2U01_0057041, partial [Trifolium medium]|nr:hypothetical protein [Trifolium medium]